jgi:hypothetical protein
MDRYIHSSIRLHVLVLNLLSIATNLSVFSFFIFYVKNDRAVYCSGDNRNSYSEGTWFIS